MKKFVFVLCLMIAASCIGCGSSGGTNKPDAESSSDVGDTEAAVVEDAASEDNETEDVSEDDKSGEDNSDNNSDDDKSDENNSEDNKSESLTKYNSFINDYTSFEVTSSNLNNGVWDDIISNTDKGSNKSPQLEWSPVEGAGLYVIIMDDPDGGDWMHWKSDNVTETSLAEGWAPASDYIGPYPPNGSTHTYEIYVVALKAAVERVKGSFNGQNLKFEENFKNLDVDADGNSGNIIAVGRISGTFTGSSSSASKLENVVLEEGNKYNCTFEDVEHDFVISLPQESENAPLIVMLHGAGDSAENFQLTNGFDNDALPKGYAVCYATGTVNAKAGRNYKSWNYGRIDLDYNDVGFIKALVNYLVDEYSLDKDHVFCAGFSNGGFMNFRLALEAQDTFLACASVSGDLCKTLWDKRPENNDVGMLAVYGEIDEAVPKNLDGSAETSLDPAIEDVIDYMASSNGLEMQSEGEIGAGSTIRKYGADSDNDIVWSVVVKDGKHGWPTEEINSFSVNDLILEFFENWR